MPDSASPTSTASSSAIISSHGASTSHTASLGAAKSPPATTGLSSPAKIGIGVGVSLGVVFSAIIVAGFVLFQRRRKRRSKAINEGNGGGAEKSGTNDEPKAQELDGDGDDAGIGPGVRELDAIESPPNSRELMGSLATLRYELE